MSNPTTLNDGGKDSNFTIRKAGLTNGESQDTMTNLISNGNKKFFLQTF